MVLATPTKYGMRLRRLHTVAVTAALVGAVGSVALTLYAGRHNPSLVLKILFSLWVLSPFAVLLLAGVISKRWSAPTRTALDSLMLVLTPLTLAMYAYVALGPPRAKTAFGFVVLPPASCLLMAVVLAIARLTSRRRSGASGRA